MVNCNQNSTRKEALKKGKQALETVKSIFEEHFLLKNLKNETEEKAPGKRRRIFTPWLTLKTFVLQVLNEDKSCQQAVLDALSEQIALGEKEFSSNTCAYSKARKKLPEKLIKEQAKELGKNLHEESELEWTFMGRRVKLVDGSTISMPDTLENQEAYPQPDSQEEGVGHPIARIVGIICLATGAVLDLAIGPYQGKKLENMHY